MNILDQQSFLWLNRELSYPALDHLMLFVSSDVLWLTVAALVICFGLIRKLPMFIPLLSRAIVVVACADLGAYRILKPFFARARPCYALETLVNLVPAGCGSPFGFPSNHASNAMGVAVITWLVLGRRAGAVMASLAVLVGFSRIYIGVHYPGDVLAGFIFGASIAAVVHFLFRFFTTKP